MKTKTQLPLSTITLMIGMLFGSIYAIADELSEKDKYFLDSTAQTGRYELEGSQLAITKSTNASVIRFAKKTVQDYTKLTNELAALAKTKELTVPTELNAMQQENLQALAGKEGAEFDAQYAAAIAEEAHANPVEYFTDAASDADDMNIRNFARKNQPGLKQHLFAARSLNNKFNP